MHVSPLFTMLNKKRPHFRTVSNKPTSSRSRITLMFPVVPKPIPCKGLQFNPRLVRIDIRTIRGRFRPINIRPKRVQYWPISIQANRWRFVAIRYWSYRGRFDRIKYQPKRGRFIAININSKRTCNRYIPLIKPSGELGNSLEIPDKQRPENRRYGFFANIKNFRKPLKINGLSFAFSWL